MVSSRTTCSIDDVGAADTHDDDDDAVVVVVLLDDVDVVALFVVGSVDVLDGEAATAKGVILRRPDDDDTCC